MDRAATCPPQNEPARIGHIVRIPLDYLPGVNDRSNLGLADLALEHALDRVGTEDEPERSQTTLPLRALFVEVVDGHGANYKGYLRRRPLRRSIASPQRARKAVMKACSLAGSTASGASASATARAMW